MTAVNCDESSRAKARREERRREGRLEIVVNLVKCLFELLTGDLINLADGRDRVLDGRDQILALSFKE